MNMMTMRTLLIIIRNLLKVINLWNQIQIKPTKHNTTLKTQIPQSSYSEICTEQKRNPPVELQQRFSDVFSSEQTQAENESSRLQRQREIEAASHILRKQELERNQLIQQSNQFDTELQNDNTTPEKTKLIPSTTKKVPPQQIEKSEFCFPIPIVFHVIKERQKRAFITDAINFTENFI